MSGTIARVAQLGVEVLHDQMPGETGRARVGQMALETVRDTADLPATRVQVAQLIAEVVHDHIPAETGTARVGQISMEVVRAITEIAVSSNSRVQVVVICA